MRDVGDLLLLLADSPLSAPEPIAALERRIVRRRRRRRAARVAGAIGCAVAVALPAVAILGRRPPPAPVGLATSQTTRPATLPGTPDDASGRFLPTWLPGNLRIQTEQEVPASTVQGTSGWSRIYVRRGALAGDQDSLVISLQTGAPPLEAEAEVARYPGARLDTVQGRPAVFLPHVAARHDAGVSWSPAPGLVAKVMGAGVSEAELITVAAGLRLPPQLDATPLPEGFTEVVRRDDQPHPALTPRTYIVGTSPARGAAPNPAFPVPSVRVAATWGASLPGGEKAGPVRGREAVLSSDDAGAGISWLERPDLLVTVSGTNLATEDLLRIAEGLREQSHAEVLRRPTGQRVVVAQGELGGAPFELRVRGGISGPCLDLVHGSVASVCASDPMRLVADLPASGSVFLGGVVFGVVVPQARTVRLELAGGQPVEVDALGADTGQGAAFYVAVLPPDAGLVAVVAIGPVGEVLRRTPAR